MENLFQLEKAKKDYLNQIHCTTITADYYRYFINLLLPTIIEESINNLKLVDIPNNDKNGHIIPINCRINIFELEDNQVIPYIAKEKDYYTLYISNNKYNKLIDKFYRFFIKNHIFYQTYSSNDPRVLSLGIKTDALSLAKAIEKEHKIYKGSIDPTLEIKKPLELVNQQIGYLSTIYADKICYDLFENIFLDKLIVSIYKEGLSLIDYRLKDNLENNTTKVKRNIFIGTRQENDLIVSEEYLEPLSLLIETFIKRYDLGYIQRCAYENGIYINTELNRLRNAYYMEKQKMEQDLTQQAYQFKQIKRI